MNTAAHLEADHNIEPRKFEGLDLDYFHDDLHAHDLLAADHEHDA